MGANVPGDLARRGLSIAEIPRPTTLQENDMNLSEQYDKEPIDFLVAFVIFMISVVLLFSADWKILLGIIMFQWSQNIQDSIK